MWIANLRQSCGELIDGSLPGISIIKIDMASFFQIQSKGDVHLWTFKGSSTYSASRNL